MKPKNTALKYSEKVDTKITPGMLGNIKDLMQKEDRNMSEMLRVLIKRGIAETILEPGVV